MKQIYNKIKINNNYINVKDEWLNNIDKSKTTKIIKQRYFEYEGKKLYVEGKKVIFEPSISERKCAKWLQKTLNENVILLPRVNSPEKVSTADFLFRNEYWDLKEITSSNEQALYHGICKNKKQSNNFIFDLTNSKLSNSDILFQISRLYERPDTKFINKLIIKKDNKLVSIFKRNKKRM